MSQILRPLESFLFRIDDFSAMMAKVGNSLKANRHWTNSDFLISAGAFAHLHSSWCKFIEEFAILRRWETLCGLPLGGSSAKVEKYFIDQSRSLAKGNSPYLKWNQLNWSNSALGRMGIPSRIQSSFIPVAGASSNIGVSIFGNDGAYQYSPINFLNEIRNYFEHPFEDAAGRLSNSLKLIGYTSVRSFISSRENGVSPALLLLEDVTERAKMVNALI